MTVRGKKKAASIEPIVYLYAERKKENRQSSFIQEKRPRLIGSVGVGTKEANYKGKRKKELAFEQAHYHNRGVREGTKGRGKEPLSRAGEGGHETRTTRTVCAVARNTQKPFGRN